MQVRQSSNQIKAKSWLLLFFMILGCDVFPQGADVFILRKINSAETLPSDGFFRTISNSHIYIIAAADLSAGIAGFAKNDQKLKKTALEIIVSQLVTTGTTQALKYTIRRERPFDRYDDIFIKIRVHDPSFPSGHTSAAFAAATSLSLSCPKWYIIVPSYGWSATVAYSRMHLGAHYPSDVLTGAIIGSGCAWLTHIVNKKLFK